MKTILFVTLACAFFTTLTTFANPTHIDRKPAVIAPPVYIEPSDTMEDMLRISTSEISFGEEPAPTLEAKPTVAPVTDLPNKELPSKDFNEDET